MLCGCRFESDRPTHQSDFRERIGSVLRGGRDPPDCHRASAAGRRRPGSRRPLAARMGVPARPASAGKRRCAPRRATGEKIDFCFNTLQGKRRRKKKKTTDRRDRVPREADGRRRRGHDGHERRFWNAQQLHRVDDGVEAERVPRRARVLALAIHIHVCNTENDI